MKGYESKITYCTKELTKKETIKLKDTADALRLDIATANGQELIITPVLFACISVHNENSKDGKDYNNYVVIDANGSKYVTGSQAFAEALDDLFKEMDGEDFDIKIYQKESKNYKGKYFITCSIV